MKQSFSVRALAPSVLMLLAGSAASQPCQPVLLSEYPGAFADVAIEGDLAYLAGVSGLTILDVSNPSSPVLVSEFAGCNWSSIQVRNGLVYAGNACKHLDPAFYVIDVSIPASPFQRGTWGQLGGAPTWPSIVEIVSDDHVAVGTGQGWVCNVQFELLDVSNPDDPVNVQSLWSSSGSFTISTPKDMAVSGSRVLMTARHEWCTPLSPDSLRMFDLATGLAGEIPLNSPWGVDAAGNYAYVGAGSPAATAALYVIDISVNNPSVVSTSNIYAVPRGVRRVRQVAAVVMSDGFRVIDVGDPLNPHDLGKFGRANYPRSAAALGDLVFITTLDALEIHDLSSCQWCRGDCDRSGFADVFDFLCFQNAVVLQNFAIADCDDDGAIDFFDYLCFQNAFAAGCD